MSFHSNDGDFLPTLFPVERVSDALADYCRQRAPVGRRKWAARHFGLSDEAARTVCEGNPSKATLDHCFRTGGWPLVIDVFTRIFGEHISQHFAREAKRHEAIARESLAWAGSGARDRPDDAEQPSWRPRPASRQMGKRPA